MVPYPVNAKTIPALKFETRLSATGSIRIIGAKHFILYRDLVRFSNPGGQAVVWWA